jgi:hypothetical protein
MAPPTALSIIDSSSHLSMLPAKDMFVRETETTTPPPEWLLGSPQQRQRSLPSLYKPMSLRNVRLHDHQEDSVDEVTSQQASSAGLRVARKKYDPLSSSSSLSRTSTPSRITSPNHRERERSVSPVRAKESLIVLDWDDTLLPTSFISQCQQEYQGRQNEARAEKRDSRNSSFTVPLTVDELANFELPPKVREQIVLLEHNAIKFVQSCLSKADVIIVTNSDQGWVEYTGGLYMPMLLKLIELSRIPIISARSLYEQFHPDDLTSWKVQAFMAEIKKRGVSLKNFVSIGDGEYERNAAKICAEEIPDIKVQAMKFVSRPDLKQLQKQLQLSENILKNLLPSQGTYNINLVA